MSRGYKVASFARACFYTRNKSSTYEVSSCFASSLAHCLKETGSGQGKTAPQSVGTLISFNEQLREMRSDLQLLVGSGINAETLPPLLRALEPHRRTQEIHLSGGMWVDGQTLPASRKEGMQMGAGNGNDWKLWRTQCKNVAATYDVFCKFRQEHM